jgi:hypothetical protein
MRLRLKLESGGAAVKQDRAADESNRQLPSIYTLMFSASNGLHTTAYAPSLSMS